MTRRLYYFLSAVLLMAGCGNAAPELPAATPVTGKILLANGQPLRSGRVTFYPEGQVAGIEAFAEIQADGSYTLTTYKLNDGAVPGRYVVTVTPYSYKTGNLKVSDPSLIPQAYWEKDTSKLTAEVKAGENSLPPLILR
jgi:hypothetical protein